jgi:hypothetical protein
MPAPTRRTNRGSGHSYFLDGEPVAGVTTILRDGIPKGNLVGWAARSVAGYAVDRWDELAALTPSKRLRELERAAWNERDAAAGRGSAVHRLADELARGLEVEIPDALIGHVDAYLEFVQAFGVVELAVERTVISRRWRYMGTVDLLATIDDEPGVVLIDWKTGGSGIWPETSLQLAAYAHAETMIDDAGVELELPPIERAFAVWLRADGYDVYPVDVSDETFRVFLYAQQVARFTAGTQTNEDRARYIGAALERRELETAS